jgi:hypothetical protein
VRQEHYSARTAIKSVFEYIDKQYHSSIKKRKSWTIAGYSIQTFCGAVAPAGVFVVVLYLITTFERHFACLSPGKPVTFVFIGVALIWLYWIFSTVIFIRNMREFTKGPLNKKDGVEIVNNNSESVDYVRLDDAQEQ